MRRVMGTVIATLALVASAAPCLAMAVPIGPGDRSENVGSSALEDESGAANFRCSARLSGLGGRGRG